MINNEFDDYFSLLGNDYDDNIIELYPFAEAFGTPDMFRPDKSRRYDEEELENMSVQERYDERIRCSKERNPLGQRDIFLYDFKKFGIYASGDSLIALTFLFGRTDAVDELMSMLQENRLLLLEVERETVSISEKMLQIGMKYPDLDDEELDYLEGLYNQTKYCALIDELLFDKEKLPRSITGITRNDLSKRNEDFPDSLKDNLFNAFEKNSEVQINNEYTEWLVYDRRNNTIIRKPYNQVGSGEFVASGSIVAFIFFNLIEEKYGEDCLQFFVNRVKNTKPGYTDIKSEMFRKWKHNWIDFRYLLQFAEDYWTDEKRINEIKRLIALAYLIQLNK